MSLPVRPLRSAPSKSASRGRRYVLIFVTLLGLFLLGTIIVLSTVKHYFGVPASAFLTEEEVPWRPEDVIARLLDPPADPTLEGEDGDMDMLAADDLTKRADWAEVSEGGAAADHTSAVSAINAPATGAPTSDDEDVSEDDGEWGIDGKGTGGYWMKADWDGKVEGTTAWDHLYNVSILEGEKMPRIIHQTWIDDTLPPKWRKAWRECREGMPDYTYMLWTDDLSRKFVATHYPNYLEMFDSYPYPIQRADSIRYFILHHFGGIYMDLDIGCRRRIDPLLQGQWEVLLPVTKPVGVSNDLLVAIPKSRFFYQTINGLKSFNHNYVTNYPTVMFSTGPMMLSAQYGLYMKRHPVTPEDPHAHVRILPTKLYGKNAPLETVPHSFFSHFYGSSWHADDAGFITWLGRWGRNLLIVGIVVLVIGGVRLLWSKVAQAGGIRAAISGGPQYQLLPVLGNLPDSGRTSPAPSFGSAPHSPTFEVPPDIGGALRRAGNILLAAPATLLPSGGRRQRGWLFFAPAAFQPTHGRRRTASEASQLPLRASRSSRRREQSPPPYESASSDGMEEVDAFLKSEFHAGDIGASGSSSSKRL